MRRRDQRLIVIAAASAVLVAAVTLTFVGLRDSVVFFVVPSELSHKAEPGRRLSIGGLVVEGTLRREGEAVRFGVTDGETQVEVRYVGLLPDLFREGQGVVAQGTWSPGQAFEADRVLAKHDENYMPREVTEALRRRGEWKGGDPPPQP